MRGVDDIRQECLARQADAAVAGPSEPARASPTFGDFVEREWRAAHRKRCKPSTMKSDGSLLRTQLLPAFGATRLDRITRAGVERWFERYSRTAPGGANRALELLRQILNFGIACGHARINPASDVRKNRRTKMTRFLSRDEVPRLHEALDAASLRGPSQRRQAAVIRLILPTGCRKGEVTNLRWSEVDGDMLTLADSKTGPRTVHLNPQARAGKALGCFPRPCGRDGRAVTK